MGTNITVMASDIQAGDVMTVFGEAVRVVETSLNTETSIVTVYRSGGRQLTFPADQRVNVRRYAD